MAVGGNEAKQPVRLAVDEEREREFRALVRHVDSLERDRVSRALQAEDIRAELAVVEPVDPLRRDERTLRVGRVRINVSEEVGEDRNDVEGRKHERGTEREL